MFNSSTFIKHYLCVEFPSIQAKKTTIIVIKNPPYFSNYNRLYQSPAMCYKEIKKSKLFFSQGSFTASLKLQKNAFAYDEMIPFEIDIDATKLSIDIKGVKVKIRRNTSKNYQYEHDKSFSKSSDTVAKKYCNNFTKGQKKIHIEDVISLDAEQNPKNIYKRLDADKRKINEKFS